MNLLRLSNRIGIAHIRPATTITPTRIPKRSYAFSGYGDGDKPQGDEPAAESTRAREHPGPAPPDTSQPKQPQEGDGEPQPSGRGTRTTPIPSNKAHPTLSDGKQSPYLDDEGNEMPNTPQDVKQHNREMERRYDRTVNQMEHKDTKGEIGKNFWAGTGGRNAA
ncbi:hypothetical protein VTN31DRAFT_1408 [Thermomyces dupontii]|uniref:uncharacterized protein n=1 Tax=Talaromyces thermophilus TaxID=28565 RepID=UPI00374469F5